MKWFSTILFSMLMVFGFTGSMLGQVTPEDAWINEFHYDNDGVDEGEFLEVVIKDAGNHDLDDFTVTHYNGSNGEVIDSEIIGNFSVGETRGDYSIYYWQPSSFQNGNDGFALSHNGSVIQFLSYEGSFQATEGVANTLNADDIGLSESSSTQIGESLQLTGSGYGYDDFSWSGPSSDSPGLVNNGQSLTPSVQFSQAGVTVNEAAGTVNIEVKIELPDGNAVDVDVVFQQNVSTAEASDFTTSTTQTVSFGSGAADGDIQQALFSLDDDSNYEGVETAKFILTNISTSGAATIGGQSEFVLAIEDNETPNVVINEFLADPGGEDVDGNQNENASGSDDEFIEIYNYGSVSVDISGWKLSDDSSNITHEFSEGTILHPSHAIVVFSEDSDDPIPTGLFGGSIVVVSNDGVLSLNNSGDAPTLFDDEENIIDSYDYSSSNEGISWVRNPDGTGDFIEHDEVSGTNGNYSPGTKADGSLFTTDLVIEGNAGWHMLSAPVENMPISELTDDTPIQGFGDGFDRNFYTGYDGSAFTAPVDLSGNLTSGEGFILYFYNNNQANSSTLPIVIDVGSNLEPTNDVSVNVHSNGNGWNLLGNPYQTAFDVTSITVDQGALASAVAQIWSDKEESYILTSSNDDRVAPGQGFFIQNDTSDAGTPATEITLPISGKTTGTRFYKSNHQKAYVQLALISESINGNGVQKDLSTMLYFHSEAKTGQDKWDAEKLYPFKQQSYSLLNIVAEGGYKVKAQDSRAFENLGEETFHLDVEAFNVSQQHTLKWEKSSGIPEGWQFTFADNKTGEEIIMDKDFSYSFTQYEISNSSDTTATKLFNSLTVDTAVAQNPRFTIILNKDEAVSNESTTNKPREFSLAQNYPNPFNPATSIMYSIVKAGKVELTVYNVMGQKVTELVNDTKQAGEYRVTWNAAEVASGVYYYRLQTGGNIMTRKMTLIK